MISLLILVIGTVFPSRVWLTVPTPSSKSSLPASAFVIVLVLVLVVILPFSYGLYVILSKVKYKSSYQSKQAYRTNHPYT